MKTVTCNLDIRPQTILLPCECSPEKILFFDIETTGLKKETSQVYLIGCAFCDAGEWKIRQWLAQSGRDEEYILEDFLDFASGFNVLVHFNGDGFDVPYLKYKAQYYMLDFSLERLSGVDIYKSIKICRNLLGLSSMSQKSVETFMGINRDDRFNGGELIPVYYEYEKSGSTESEKLLLLHNHDDLEGMLRILPAFLYAGIFHGNYSFYEKQILDDVLICSYKLTADLPADFCCFTDEGGEIQICGHEQLLKIRIRIYGVTARLYLENVSDYYYLPSEDRVIHKDVAVFTDRKNRVKATRKNCFVRKTGRFIPFFESWEGKVYISETDPGKKLIDMEDILAPSDSFSIFGEIGKDILGAIMSC